MQFKQYLNAIEDLENRNEQFLHVTAYENQMSKTASHFLGSKLSERYYFGGGDDNGVIDWKPFTCLGLKAVEDIVAAAERAAATMMHGQVANLRLLSGVHAMLCAILVATEPGDTIMVVHHDDGGHFSTQPLLQRSGRQAVYATYDTTELQFDVLKTAQTFRDKNCKAVYLDISYCITPVNLRELREALGDAAIIIYDASHTIGLMMGGEFQSPLLEGADLVCANTHKTLPGPQKGMVVFRDKRWGGALNDVINNGLFSSSHTHHLIALAISVLEMSEYGKSYARQIIRNSNALGSSLANLGYNIRQTPGGEYSQTHQVHMFLPDEIPASVLYRRLVENNISTNFDDRLGGRTFARLGTQEISHRGMKERDMEQLARLINQALRGHDVGTQVADFNGRFRNIEYSFDLEWQA